MKIWNSSRNILSVSWLEHAIYDLKKSYKNKINKNLKWDASVYRIGSWVMERSVSWFICIYIFFIIIFLTHRPFATKRDNCLTDRKTIYHYRSRGSDNDSLFSACTYGLSGLLFSDGRAWVYSARALMHYIVDYTAVVVHRYLCLQCGKQRASEATG